MVSSAIRSALRLAPLVFMLGLAAGCGDGTGEVAPPPDGTGAPPAAVENVPPEKVQEINAEGSGSGMPDSAAQ